jgi:DNA-binding transcriptional LysR family regulator
MDLRQLTQFVTVADEKSFRKAAAKLFMAQPPLSIAVRKLEDEVGHALLLRNSQGVALTAAGQAVYLAARRCLQAAQAIVPAAHSAAQGDEGELRIGFVGSVTFGLMPRLVGAFTQAHPRVKLELREGSNTDLYGALAREEIDLAFIRLPVARPVGMVCETIEEDVMCAALPLGHPLTRKRSLRVADLAAQPMLGYSPTRAGALHMAALQVFQDSPVAPVFNEAAIQVPTMVGLVEAKLGIAVVPSAIAPHYERRIALRPIRDLPASARIHIALAWRDTEADAAKVAAFVQIARVQRMAGL